MAALAIMEADAEAISKRAVELALAGDLTAIRLVLDRLVSPARDRPIQLALPKINAASDLIAAASALTEATAASKGTSSAEGCLERARGYPKRRSNSRSRRGRDGHRFESPQLHRETGPNRRDFSGSEIARDFHTLCAAGQLIFPPPLDRVKSSATGDESGRHFDARNGILSLRGSREPLNCRRVWRRCRRPQVPPAGLS
jgi:hypothetical protein